MSEVTRLINLVADGNEPAKARLFEIVYGELRVIATKRMSHEIVDHTLTPTALVNEAYLKLFPNSEQPDFQNRRYFYAAAANAMCQVLVDYARKRNAFNRGGSGRKPPDSVVENDATQFNSGCKWQRIPLVDGEDLIEPVIDIQQVLQVDAALTRLAVESGDEAELVKLRFFAGLTIPEAANFLGISVAIANRRWAFARAWLSCELKELSDVASPIVKQ